MTVQELIDVLKSYDQNSEILISDGINRYHFQYETISEMMLDENLEPEENNKLEKYVVIGEDY